jgi:hypothetical protein
MGCSVIVVLVIVGSIAGAITGRSSSGSQPDACYEAQNARSIANSSANEGNRSTATLQYAVKKAECEAAGGRVPGS